MAQRAERMAKKMRLAPCFSWQPFLRKKSNVLYVKK